MTRLESSAVRVAIGDHAPSATGEPGPPRGIGVADAGAPEGDELAAATPRPSSGVERQYSIPLMSAIKVACGSSQSTSVTPTVKSARPTITATASTYPSARRNGSSRSQRRRESRTLAPQAIRSID